MEERPGVSSLLNIAYPRMVAAQAHHIIPGWQLNGNSMTIMGYWDTKARRFR